jgi:hypothetical protein
VAFPLVSDGLSGCELQKTLTWHHYLLRWLLQNTSSLRAAPYERIRSYLLTVAPGLSDEEIRKELSSLRAQGVVREKRRALGGRYWFVPEDWRRALGRGRQTSTESLLPEALPPAGPAEAGHGVCETSALAQEEVPAGGDILELLKGTALEHLVLLIMRMKGCRRVPESPAVPYNGTPMDVWAEAQDGTLILVECKGWDERVCQATVAEFVDRVRHVCDQEPYRNVESWLVSTAEMSAQTEAFCRDAGLMLLKTLDLLRDALAYGIIGIGLRSIRPYVARIGEHGVFLQPEGLKAVYGDPTLVVRIV